MSDVVGSARIQILPDFTGFEPAVVAGAESAGAAAQTILEQAFQDAANAIETSMSQAAEAAGAALEGVGAEAASGVPAEFAAAAAEIASTMEAAAAESDAALSSIGAGAGDAVEAEFAGVGAAIEAEVEAAASSGSGSFGDLGGAAEKAASDAESAWDKASSGIVGGLALIGVGIAGTELIEAGERIVSVAAASEQLVRTTGGVANVAAAEIATIGDELERLTGIDSELTQEASNILLTFKNVRNEVGEGNDIFTRAIGLGADLSAVLGGDLTGSALQLGKALQDPTRGVNLLRRAGVDFTTTQREMIAGFVEQNDLLSAQRIILDEVESQVGGVAEASARSSDIIKTQLGNVVEEFALGLLPALDRLAAEGPALLEAFGPSAGELGAAFGDVLELAVEALIELSPLLGTTADLLVALTPVLELAVDLLGAIPAPVLQGAAALFTINRALGLLQGQRVAAFVTTVVGGFQRVQAQALTTAGALNSVNAAGPSGAGGFVAGLRSMTTGLSGVTLAATAGFAAIQLWDSANQALQNRASEFGQNVRDGYDLAAMSSEELSELSLNLNRNIEDLYDTAASSRAPWDEDYRRELRAGASELEAFQEEVDATRLEIIRLEAETAFGGIADGVLGQVDNLRVLREESIEAAAAVQFLQLRGTESDQTFLDLAGALDDAALSEEAMAAAAELLGTDVQSLQTYVEEVTGALEEFVTTAVEQFPNVAQAFRDTNEDNRVTAGEFLTNLQTDTAELTTFFSNLETLIGAGFTDIAAELATQGVEAAGTVASQLATAATNGNTALLEATRTGLAERDAAIQASTDLLTNTLGPAFVTASGIVADAAAAAFGENFDPEERARIAMGLTETTLGEEGLRVAAVAALEGEDAAREFGAGLNLSQTVIEQAVAAGNALRENDDIVNAATAAGTGVGAAFAVGTANGMRIELQEVRNAAGEIVFSAADAAALAGRIRSPSKLFEEEIGKPISQGIAVGITESADLVGDAVSSVLTDAVQQPVIDVTARSGSIATGRSLSRLDVGSSEFAAGGRPIIIERLELPTAEPEQAASAIIDGLVGINVGIGTS